LDYDYLVVATGSKLCPEGLPGFEAAHHFYDLDASIRLREVLENFPGGRVLTLSTAEAMGFSVLQGLALHHTGFWAVPNQPLDRAYSSTPLPEPPLLFGPEPYSGFWTSRPHA